MGTIRIDRTGLSMLPRYLILILFPPDVNAQQLAEDYAVGRSAVGEHRVGSA